MLPEIIPIDRAARPMSAQGDSQGGVVARLHAELARVMELRQRSEQELQVIRERAMAQDNLAALGQLAACAAHEIHQPLSYLKIFCDSIIKDSDAETVSLPNLWGEAREACRQIARIQKITQQMLRFARPASESFLPQDLPSALARALVLMTPQLRRYGVKLATSQDEPLSPIQGSAGMLEQIFINLLQNAIDALAHQDEKKIHIHFSQQNNNAVVTVRDNGPGVAEAIRERVFEPFFTTKSSGQGTGLGLTICADIVRAHQGTIVLSNATKRGAEFVIKFSLLREGHSPSDESGVG